MTKEKKNERSMDKKERADKRVSNEILREREMRTASTSQGNDQGFVGRLFSLDSRQKGGGESPTLACSVLLLLFYI